MSNTLMIKNFKAEGAVAAFTVVKPGTADGQVLAGAAATDKLLGVSTDIPAAIGERCDVILSGLADVVYGGAVTRGDMLTSDATGRAVTAAPIAGVNNRIIGMAVVSGVAGDIGVVSIAQSTLQG